MSDREQIYKHIEAAILMRDQGKPLLAYDQSMMALELCAKDEKWEAYKSQYGTNWISKNRQLLILKKDNRTFLGLSFVGSRFWVFDQGTFTTQSQIKDFFERNRITGIDID